jgi:hypothetical protein
MSNTSNPRARDGHRCSYVSSAGAREVSKNGTIFSTTSEAIPRRNPSFVQSSAVASPSPKRVT